MVFAANSAREKLKALEMVMKNCGGKSSNFDASPVLERIAKRLEDVKTKAESNKMETAGADVVKTMDSEKYGVEENTGPDSR